MRAPANKAPSIHQDGPSSHGSLIATQHLVTLARLAATITLNPSMFTWQYLPNHIPHEKKNYIIEFAIIQSID
jgi:hypothetical protein